MKTTVKEQAVIFVSVVKWALLATVAGIVVGAATTPIAASIMAIELFGPEVASYAAIACVISFVISWHRRSAYASQIVFVKKSSSIDIDIGSEIGKATPVYRARQPALCFKPALATDFNGAKQRPLGIIYARGGIGLICSGSGAGRPIAKPCA